jgi:hypothetical protein
MRTRILLALTAAMALSVLPALAQQTVKRSEVELLPVGPPPEEVAPQSWGLFDFTTSLEFGYQDAEVHANEDVYRSQVNYSDGIRVFGFNLEGKSRDPGAPITRLYIRGAGWGGDPYNWLYYGMSKDRWFDFKASYVRSDYFFVYPGFARNEHRNDQQRRRQSYEFTLFPQRKLRFRFGYFRNSSFGFPMLTTFDFSRDEFTMFEPPRSTYDEYRFGVDWNIQRWSFFFDYNYRFLRNDRFLHLVTPPIPNPGNNVPPPATSTTFLTESDRLYPGRGRIPFARFAFTGRPLRTLDLSGQLAYSRPKFDDYGRFEFDDGRTFDPSGAPPSVLITNSISSAGAIIRPDTIVDLSAVWRPIAKLTFTDSFRFNGFDISGQNLTNIFTTCSAATDPAACNPGLQAENPSNLYDVDYFVNRFEIRYDFTPKLGVRAGERYLKRDTQLVHVEVACDNASLPGCVGGTLAIAEETEPATRVANVLLAGGDWRPRKNLSFFVDFEYGGIDSVFNRIRQGNQTIFRARGRWEPTEGVHVSSSFFLFDLRAPAPEVDSNQRNHGVTVDLTLSRWQRFYWDIGYARNDVSSFTDIGRRVSATSFVLVDGFTGVDCTLVGGVWLRNVALGLPCRPSTYIDNNNYIYFDLGGRLIGNLHGEIGYRLFTATGTYAPSDPEGACPLVYYGPCSPFPGVRAEWGGLNFHQPHVQLEYVFSDKVSWKAGWRWYGYNTKLGTASDYRAHIITTSVVLKF